MSIIDTHYSFKNELLSSTYRRDMCFPNQLIIGDGFTWKQAQTMDFKIYDKDILMHEYVFRKDKRNNLYVYDIVSKQRLRDPKYKFVIKNGIIVKDPKYKEVEDEENKFAKAFIDGVKK